VKNVNRVDSNSHGEKWCALWLLAHVSAAIYLALTLLGPRYRLGIDHVDRPLLLVLGLFSAAFFLYLLALAIAVRLPDSKQLGWWIFGTSVAFRALLLPSPPFMEIDLYRYAWDGVVAVEGESPFRYSPLQVNLAASKLEFDMPVDDPSLAKLAAVVRSDAGIAQVLDTVHFSELRTVYPPVSQMVFQATACLTPDGVSADRRVLLIKVAMVLFDLATLAMVIGLLRLTGRPIGWALVYGWCPLVLKEFANSGHLDTITIALTIAAIFAAGIGLRQEKRRRRWALASGALLALAVGAKLYPFVLAPWLVFTWWRRGSAKLGLATGMVLVAGSLLCLRPMHHFEPQPRPAPVVASHADDLSPPPQLEADAVLQTQLEGATAHNNGLLAFFQRWEMNDLFFAVVVENLRPQAEVKPKRRPWFTVVPDAWSESMVHRWATWVDHRVEAAGIAHWEKLANNHPRASFLLARLLTGLAFLAIALVLGWRASNKRVTMDRWLEAALLTLAWFWLLSPTQNPWYWCWVVPLLPFARGRAWLVVSGLVMAYYLRFWLKAHYDSPPLLGTPYDGVHFFHYVVVAWEHGIYLLWLMVAWCWRQTSWRPTKPGKETP